MKTLRDTNNNNSNTTQQHFPSNTPSAAATNRQNFISSNESVHQNSIVTDSESLLNQNHRFQPQTIWRAHNGTSQFS